MMPVMPSTSAVTRLVLVHTTPSERVRQPGSARRYRVARLQLVDDVVARNARFSHLKAAHD